VRRRRLDRNLTRVVVAAVALLFAVVACGGDDVQNEGAIGALPPPRTSESTLFPRVDVPGPSVDVWRPRGLRQALDALQRAAGGRLLMIQLVLYPEYAILEARDPGQRENVDRYLFRAGKVDAPSPVMTTANVDLESKTFLRSQVVFEAIPRLLREAPARLAIAGARPTHVIVERDTVFAGGAVVIRVYAGTARRSGYVEYDGQGTLRKVST
jgi:hypothetical protein